MEPLQCTVFIEEVRNISEVVLNAEANPWGQNCGTTGKVCAGTTGIPIQIRLLCFWSSCLLIHLWEQRKMALGLWPWTPKWKTWKKLLLPAFGSLPSCLLQPSAEEKRRWNNYLIISFLSLPHHYYSGIQTNVFTEKNCFVHNRIMLTMIIFWILFLPELEKSHGGVWIHVVV